MNQTGPVLGETSAASEVGGGLQSISGPWRGISDSRLLRSRGRDDAPSDSGAGNILAHPWEFLHSRGPYCSFILRRVIHPMKSQTPTPVSYTIAVAFTTIVSAKLPDVNVFFMINCFLLEIWFGFMIPFYYLIIFFFIYLFFQVPSSGLWRHVSGHRQGISDHKSTWSAWGRDNTP